MLPPSLYAPIYHQAMLLVIFGCALFYWAGQGQAQNLAQFNQVAMVVTGAGVLLFMGFRPVSGVFIDMTQYAKSYEDVLQGGKGNLPDGLFNVLMRLCALFLSTGAFFFVCALTYIAPLAVASWRVHGVWAFPVFLACLTALSFWAYGVNGIRNGIATSVLILAFAFHDKPVVMFALMAAALGLHGSTILPAVAFLLVRYVRRTEIWLAFWFACAALTLIAGNVGEMLLSRYNPFAWDNRVEEYILGSEGSGFRADFLAYSIIPVLATLLLASPTRARSRHFAAQTRRSAALPWMGNRSPMTPKRIGMGRLAWLQGASRAGSVGLAILRFVNRNGRSNLQGAKKAPDSRELSARHDETSQSAWGRLPGVRLLRSDPFYARLVNTYLLANAVWVLAIHASFSNRFAYLSWFMMPWVLLYPFVPGKIIHRPRTGLIAAVLCAHYMFTYVMEVVVYPLRGMQ